MANVCMRGRQEEGQYEDVVDWIEGGGVYCDIFCG